MNSRWFLFPLLALLSGAVCLGDDRIVSIDQPSKTLIVEQNGTLKVYQAIDSTDVTVNGTKATLQQLTPGQSVTVKLAGAITALKIDASGLGGTSPARQLALRSVIVQIRVDVTDRISTRTASCGSSTCQREIRPNIFINGIPWSPKWNGEKTDQFTAFKVPMAPIGSSHITLKQTAGRTKAKQEHSPLAPAVVTINDSPGGADDYEFQFSW